MRRLLFLLSLLVFACAKKADTVEAPQKLLTFEVSFDDSWHRIQSYKLSDSGRFSYFLVTINQHDAENFADTVMGQKVLLPADLDSMDMILREVIADTLSDRDVMCFDCGKGYLVYREKEYHVAYSSVPQLFRLEEFVRADSTSSAGVDVSSYTTWQKLMPGE